MRIQFLKRMFQLFFLSSGLILAGCSNGGFEANSDSLLNPSTLSGVSPADTGNIQTLNQTSIQLAGNYAEDLFISLQNTGVPNSGNLGATTFNASEIECFPPSPTNSTSACRVHLENSSLMMPPADASRFIDVLTRVAEHFNGGPVASGTFIIHHVSCWKAVVPGATATCKFSTTDR